MRGISPKVVVTFLISFVTMYALNSSKFLSLILADSFSNFVEIPASPSHDVSILKALSNPATFLHTVKRLYNQYGSEIRSYRPVMRKWCQVTHNCKFTDFEVEMLYMILRETKPQRVFEMAPNKGFSTHWILEALTQNDKSSTLYSYDVHNASLKFMKNPKFQERWIFTQGDYRDLLKSGELRMDKFDFIFIDALHNEEFSRGYCRNLLLPLQQQAVVAIHDIVADEFGGGRESAEVYKYMAFSPNVKNVFTMSRFGMPSILSPVENAVKLVHEIRASHGIVKPCNLATNDCKEAVYDPLYFVNNDAPTLFFQLN
jgi:predicted O-methyltransferase YrrM